jgi:hypothetical protein
MQLICYPTVLHTVLEALGYQWAWKFRQERRKALRFPIVMDEIFNLFLTMSLWRRTANDEYDRSIVDFDSVSRDIQLRQRRPLSLWLPYKEINSDKWKTWSVKLISDDVQALKSR